LLVMLSEEHNKLKCTAEVVHAKRRKQVCWTGHKLADMDAWF
jgi:hypothetical protein